MDPRVAKVLGSPKRRENIFANYLQNNFTKLLGKHTSLSKTSKKNPSVETVFGLSELREHILTFLLFDENQAPIIPSYKIFRLVCKPWLETTNHLIYQNLRNLKDSTRDRKKYIPIRFNYDKIPDFVRLLTKNCLETAPALPFELVLSGYKENLTEGKHHEAILTLLNKFSDGLVKINLSSPCNLGNLRLPNLQILASTIFPCDIGKGLENDIQCILDKAQDSLHSYIMQYSYTVFTMRLPSNARILPVRLPEKLHSLYIDSNCDILHLETLLSHNLGSVPNLQHLHISVDTQTTFSNPGLLYQFLSNCPRIKRIYIGRYSNVLWPGFGRNTVLCRFPLPETMKQMECIDLYLFGIICTPKKPARLLETSKRYPRWRELNIRGVAKEDLNVWTSNYPCENLKRLTFSFERQAGNENNISLGLNISHLEKIHLAYRNITYLGVYVEDEKSLEYIFTKMTNLKTLVVCHEGHERTCINWDAVLIGCSKTEILMLREDSNQDGNVIFLPNQELPSIRNMKNLHTLILCADDAFRVVPDEYQLSEVAFRCALLKMDSLLKVDIRLQNQISENMQQIWTSRPNRSIQVSEYFPERYSLTNWSEEDRRSFCKNI